MFDIVISVENVGKLYTLSPKGKGARYTTLRDVIARQEMRGENIFILVGAEK